MFKLKLSENSCRAILDHDHEVPSDLVDIFRLTNKWTCFNDLLEDGLSLDKLNVMVKGNFLSIGSEHGIFPISSRLYFEEQFPLHASARPLNQWLSAPSPFFIWLGLPYENLLELHHSNSLGCCTIINNFPYENNPFFGVLPFLQHSTECHDDLLSAYAAICHAGSRIALLGGDHSITWSLLQQIHNFQAQMPIRYIHIDAHHDMYGIQSKSKSNVCHSNFLIDLLDRKIVTEAILIGCRDDPAPIEHALLKKMPIRLLTDEIKELPIAEVHTHLSIDIDVLDPSIAPSVSNPIDNGWTKEILFDSLSILFANFRPDSVSVVEACNSCTITANAAIDVISFINFHLTDKAS